MEPVQGYLTKDGTFYPKKENARLHEAIQVVRALCESHKPQPIAPERFLQLLNMWGEAIREFIDANEEARGNKASQDSGSVGGDTADDASGDALDASVEQQQVSRHNDLSDMGHGSRTESVPERGKKHGVRVR